MNITLRDKQIIRILLQSSYYDPFYGLMFCKVYKCQTPDAYRVVENVKYILENNNTPKEILEKFKMDTLISKWGILSQLEEK